jgi:hypothetical protein
MTGIIQALLATLVITVPAKAPAGAQSFAADYAVSLYGLPIARSRFRTTISDDQFSIAGSLTSAGVAKLFDDTEGTMSASGRFSGEAVEPDAFLLSYTSGKKKQTTKIAFSGGNVTDTRNVPPLKKRKDRVPLGKGDLDAVADPLSGTLVRADSLQDVCARTIKIYDGEMRADLKLSKASDGPLWSGHEGEAVTCNVRFVPVSGYRKGRDSLEFLKNKAKIQIAFAPLGTTGVYAPVQALVGTEIGTIQIEAQNIQIK